MRRHADTDVIFAGMFPCIAGSRQDAPVKPSAADDLYDFIFWYLYSIPPLKSWYHCRLYLSKFKFPCYGISTTNSLSIHYLSYPVFILLSSPLPRWQFMHNVMYRGLAQFMDVVCSVPHLCRPISAVRIPSAVSFLPHARSRKRLA